MSDHFSDLHDVQQFGDISEHTINGEHVSIGIHTAGYEEFARTDGTREWAVRNAQGGEDVYEGTTLYEHTVPTAHGGQQIYDSGMHLKGTILPNVHHGHDFVHDGALLGSSLHLGHGTMTVLNHDDPLMHLSEYSITKLFLG